MLLGLILIEYHLFLEKCEINDADMSYNFISIFRIFTVNFYY